MAEIKLGVPKSPSPKSM